MSVLLPTNPLAARQAPLTGHATLPDARGVIAAVAGSAAPPPASGAGPASDRGSSTAYSGSGAGAGGEASQRPALTRRMADRPADATPTSIIAALIGNLPQPQSTVASTMPDPLPTSPFLKGAGQGAIHHGPNLP